MGRAYKLRDTTDGRTGFFIGFLDSHTLISESMCSLLKQQEPSVLVVSAPRPDLLLDVLRREDSAPDIIVIHVTSVEAESDSFAMAAALLKDAFPDVPLGLLSDTMNREELLSALEAGANCYFNTEVSAEVLCYLLRLAARGDIVGIVSGYTERSAEREYANGTPLPKKDGNGSFATLPAGYDGLALTARESEVLRYLTKGNSNKAIGAKLGVRENTIKVHVHNIMKKLGAHNRTEIAVMLLQDR